MSPVLLDGDTTEIRRAGEARAGDVVLARNLAGELVCHRVLTANGDGLLLAGDQSMQAELHGRDAVLGRVVAVQRRQAGRVLRFDRTRWIDRFAARLHLGAYRLRRNAAGRWLDAARRPLLTWAARA